MQKADARKLFMDADVINDQGISILFKNLIVSGFSSNRSIVIPLPHSVLQSRYDKFKRLLDEYY